MRPALTQSCRLLGAVALGLGPVGVAAEEFRFGGDIELSARYYPEDGLLPGQASSNVTPIVQGSFNASRRLTDGRLVFELSGSYNGETNEGYADLPRGFYQHFGDGFDLLVGSNIEYWGVSESHRVVDVVNQRYVLDQTVDYVSLGQPMVNVNIATGVNSTLSFYGLLGFRERDLGSAATRFRSPVVLNGGDAVFEEGQSRNFDFAVRFRTSFGIGGGGLDLAASYFEGTNRAPSALPSVCLNGAAFSPDQCIADLPDEVPDEVPDDLSDFALVPYYAKLRQAGLELVYSFGDLQLTFEGAISRSLDETYYSAIGGAQYTFGGIGSAGGNLVLVGEYLYDDRSFIQPITIYDDDVFLGFSYSGNDVGGTNIRGGVYYDLNSSAQIYTLAYSRRLNDALRFEVSGFMVNSEGTTDPLAVAQNDGYLEVSLAYFF